MGAIVNSVVVLLGSLLGLFMGQRIPERINKALMQGIALVVLSIGIIGIMQGGDSMVMILSMVLGISYSVKVSILMRMLISLLIG